MKECVPVGEGGGRRPNNIDKHVGQQIKTLRKERRITQQGLGDAVGISFKQIRKYENGENRVSAGMLYSFSQFMNVKVERFFEGLPEADRDASEFEDDEPQLQELTKLVSNYVRLHDLKSKQELLDLVRSMSDQ